MISAMDQHTSSLAQLGFGLGSPAGGHGGSDGGGGGGGAPNSAGLGPPPPLYDAAAPPPPLYSVNGMAAQAPAQHHQQSAPQQQAPQHHQAQTPPAHSMMGYGFNNIDTSYLFAGAGTTGGGGGAAAGMEVAVSSGGVISYSAQSMGQPAQPAQPQHHGICSNQAPATSGDLPDTKECIEELCPVCGDKVSGYHYGLLTCESCKGFFKRTVQNKKVYTCVAERSCHIDKTQRKRCPFCRFQKCLEVGMKLEAVRADRMRGGRNKFGPMYKRDRARKLQMMRQRQMAVQTLRGSQYGGLLGDGALSFSYQSGLSSPFSSLNIKQEIQIPQVSSLTSSPDSSPSPIAVALGQAAGLGSLAAAAGSAAAAAQNGGAGQQALQIVATSGAGGGAGPAGGAPTSNGPSGGANASSSGGGGGLGLSEQQHGKLWGTPNSTTPSPHSISPKSFQFEGGTGCSNAQKMCPLIRDFISGLDDREWQSSLFSLLQNQTYNQCEVDLFELMCKVLDQNLFSQVDWARNSVFFKDLKVDDQMKLLQHSWSDMLVLDHIHQRMHNNLQDETTLHNGQKFDLLSLGLLGVPSLHDRFTQVTHSLHDLKFDLSDYICLKFLLLLNPEVRGLMNKRHVQEGHEQVRQALADYCVSAHPQIQDKFDKLMLVLPELHEIASRGEEHLYHEHCTGNAPTQTLLMEMLHAKRK